MGPFNRQASKWRFGCKDVMITKKVHVSLQGVSSQTVRNLDQNWDILLMSCTIFSKTIRIYRMVASSTSQVFNYMVYKKFYVIKPGRLTC